jgi:hypothetical protein
MINLSYPDPLVFINLNNKKSTNKKQELPVVAMFVNG